MSMWTRKVTTLLSICVITLILMACEKIQLPTAGPKDVKKGPVSGPEYVTPYVLGQTLKFNEEQVQAYLGRGWSHKEKWGRWSEGPVAEIRFSMSPDAPDATHTLLVNGKIFMPAKQKVYVVLNGSELGELGPLFKEGTAKLEFPGKLLKKENLLTFEIEKPLSPKEEGQGQDARKLGLAIASLKFARE